VWLLCSFVRPITTSSADWWKCSHIMFIIISYFVAEKNDNWFITLQLTNVLFLSPNHRCQTTEGNHGNNKAIVDIRLCPCCALPLPPSQLIGHITSAQDSYLRLPGRLNYPFCCMTLLAIEWSLLQRTRQRWLQRRLPMLLNGPDNPKNCSFPLGFRRRSEPRP